MSEGKRSEDKNTENGTLLTVIIPVYNTAPFLKKCIESIISQLYKNLEILMIDDGSADGSGQICDEYAKADRRIKVFHKENGGVVSARKMGVELATGELITFVDSDDWIEADMYQYLIKLYEEEHSDLVTSGMIYEWEDRTDILLDSVEEGNYNKEEIYSNVLPRMIYDYKAGRRGITASVSNKLFRASLLKKVIPAIDNELTLGEDGAIMYCFAAQTNKITVTKGTFYHYVQHEGSAIRKRDLESFEKIHRLEKSLMTGFEELNLKEKMRNQTAHYVKSFLEYTIKGMYQIDLVNPISFIFPYEEIPQGSRVVLYGAGRMGQSFWRCLRYGEYAAAVAWVDSDYEEKRWIQWDVESPEVIKNREYDYIVIAVLDEKIALEIRRNLLAFGVEPEKIIWKKRRRVI